MFKGDVAENRFEVLRFGRKAVPVAQDNLRGVLHVRLCVKEARNPLNVGLHADKVGKELGELLHRLENADRIGDEDRKHTKGHELRLHHLTAPPQYDRRRK
ncbi:hypothetical protein SDC9_105460 [bioreactor metagenome]|uniref:Uncharacterized protein n=1 Tax=bioreactor metagenome TaxID=1076179 RepID=A0A645B0R7_9ZZZZ